MPDDDDRIDLMVRACAVAGIGEINPDNVGVAVSAITRVCPDATTDEAELAVSRYNASLDRLPMRLNVDPSSPFAELIERGRLMEQITTCRCWRFRSAADTC